MYSYIAATSVLRVLYFPQYHACISAFIIPHPQANILLIRGRFLSSKQRVTLHKFHFAGRFCPLIYFVYAAPAGCPRFGASSAQHHLAGMYRRVPVPASSQLLLPSRLQ